MRLCSLPSPCYIIDKAALTGNLQLLHQVMQASGCKILLAQKAFAAYALYPLIGSYLSGAAASGLFEARLSREEMGKETHVFSPAFREDEIGEILGYADHIVFNSLDQWRRFGALTVEAGVEAGLRINPECSTQSGPAIYDPCAPGSRLGIVTGAMPDRLPAGVSGLHFHTLCEQNADALSVTMAAVEEKFARQLRQISWLNMGGGHHITRAGYDLDQLYRLLRRVREDYGLQIYLEPGEAVALNAGYLYCTVLDIVENRGQIAILDASAACHMPDVLEMPYRPPLLDAAMPGEKPYTYRLAGPTCLAGDVIGEYSFDRPLRPGSALLFADMAIYTMVKNNTFNGMALPAIAIKEGDDDYSLLKTFAYEDFKGRLC
ncbi:MAG: carboxynorspermidine decarboxylase [Firmicutes bacterium]|nr:carboxynorspermidine decarboxylase [Bacillota bacterium]